MKYNNVLIGAMGVGKTTMSNLICEKNELFSVLGFGVVKQTLVTLSNPK